MSAKFTAIAATGTAPWRAVQVVRNYDGSIFAMSPDDARKLSTQLTEAAELVDARKGRTGPTSPSDDDERFVKLLEASESWSGSLARLMRRQGATTAEIAQQFTALRKLDPDRWGGDL